MGLYVWDCMYVCMYVCMCTHCHADDDPSVAIP